MFDIVISGGTVVDGTGSAPYTADVAVQDGRIVEIGEGQRRVPRDASMPTARWWPPAGSTSIPITTAR